MVTHPHENNSNGYALRLGKNLPAHAANLAYIHTDTPAPRKNVVIDDYTQNLPENSLRLEETGSIEAFVNKEGVLETAEGALTLKRPDVLLTNEYSLDEDQAPLFYKHRSRYLFDARNATVAHPLNGKTTADARLFDEFSPEEALRFILKDGQVAIKDPSGEDLPRQYKYKVGLEKADEDAHLYRLVIYTSFDGRDKTAQVHYPAVGQDRHHKETLNPTPVFSEYQGQANEEQRYSYQVKRLADGSYQVELPTESNQFVVTEGERPGHSFSYQLISDVSTRLSDKNPLEVNIGIIYINDTIINAVRTVSALKKLVYENAYMPDYLDFKNPHRQPGYHDKSDALYWEADINMPADHWLDYDVIILSGYGDKDFSNTAAAMRAYLDTGAILIMDTAGEGAQVLNPVTQEGNQSFVANVSYSPSESETTHRAFTPEAEMKDRYYDIAHPENIGRIAPQIRLHGEENIDDWNVFLKHANGGPALMRKGTGFTGQLILSNMGWMLDVLFGKQEAIQFFSNFLLYCLESRQFISPVFKEHVYHKDDLYKEEYKNAQGKVFYYDDRSDEDDSQIVAKKQLHDDIGVFAREFLPEAYRQHQTIAYKVVLEDNGNIPVVNGTFEQNSQDGQVSWEQTTLGALPGFDFIRFSGDSTRGEHTAQVKRSGRRSLMVETIGAQGFFEQDLGVLAEGSYEFTTYVKGVNATGGGFGLYDTDGNLLVESPDASGTFHWRQEKVDLQLDTPKQVYLRLGAHGKNETTKLYFDDLSFKTNSVVRMNQRTSGNEPLYAYAVAPRGKNNRLNTYEQNQEVRDVLKINTDVSATLTVQSFVYQWVSSDGRFKKMYGNQKDTRFTLNTSGKEEILGDLQSFLPTLKSGAEWARKDRVYYEITLGTSEAKEFINIDLYDPSVDRHYFRPNGQWVINHQDIHWNGIDATVQVRASLLLYHLELTGNLYTVTQLPEDQIRIAPPRTQDERDRWYLSIQNGAFQKKTLHSEDQKAVKENDRETYYSDYLIGEHEYQLPEYRRQSFYPRFGERLITNEYAQYRDDHTVQVTSTPLLVKEETVTKEALQPAGKDRAIWQSKHIHWDKTHLPTVYIDEWNNGNLVVQTDGFIIDYTEGTVTLAVPTDGTVYASYRHDNFVITRRRYANERTTGELLRSRDNYTFEMNGTNLAVSPAPVFYRGTRKQETIIQPSRYWIDHLAGTVTFFNETRERIYADYLTFTEEELHWVDVNQYTGEITTNERLSFRDEVHVTYVAKENHLIYKGYYDEESEAFMHLDLNPTAGHTFSSKEKVDGEWEITEVESERLLNKEVFLYLLPYRSIYYKTEQTEPYPTRHVFGEAEWNMVKTTYPQAQLLARVQVRENTTPENIVVMDARQAGGGLKEHIGQKDIEKRIGYTSAFWDINGFDGMAYYKNGVSIIRIPSSVLKENGGRFEHHDIKAIVDKYVAYGVYPIIEFTEEVLV